MRRDKLEETPAEVPSSYNRGLVDGPLANVVYNQANGEGARND
jgi:hypothetical protein